MTDGCDFTFGEGRDLMLIEIETVYGDKIIHGRHFEYTELKNVFRNFIATVSEKDFVATFCADYGYEEISYADDIVVDYVIDLDTHMLIKPKF